MKKEKSCGFIIFTNVEGVINFLIIQQLEGFHSFPKGHMEGNETELETAFREVKEEVNIIPTLIEGFRESESHLIPSRNNVLKECVYFLGYYENQEIIYQESELKGAYLLTYEEAISVFEYENTKELLFKANQFLINSYK